MTEFALLLPVLLLLIVGVIEGGRLVSIWLTLEHAVVEGARAGAVATGDPARAATLAADVLALTNKQTEGATIDPARLTVTATVGSEPDGVLSVDARYNTDLLTPLVSGLFPKGITLRAHSDMRVE